MYREQAVEIIERHIDNNIASGSLVEQALSMAIDALKAQLSQEGTTKDTISRQAAIDVIEDYPHGNVWNVEGMEEMVDKIKVLPTAQPEPQEGRFERKRDGVFCSVCHYGWEFITGVPAEVEREYHYCPKCGAKMKGERQK